MIQWIRELAAKSEDLSSIPIWSRKEKTPTSCPLTSTGTSILSKHRPIHVKKLRQWMKVKLTSLTCVTESSSDTTFTWILLEITLKSQT